MSPDGRYVVTHTYGDNCGGATVAYSHSVQLHQTARPRRGVLLLDTYRSPKGIEIRWVDPHHLEVVGNGMKDVSVRYKYAEAQWEDVAVRVVLND